MYGSTVYRSGNLKRGPKGSPKIFVGISLSLPFPPLIFSPIRMHPTRPFPYSFYTFFSGHSNRKAEGERGGGRRKRESGFSFLSFPLLLFPFISPHHLNLTFYVLGHRERERGKIRVVLCSVQQECLCAAESYFCPSVSPPARGENNTPKKERERERGRERETKTIAIISCNPSHPPLSFLQVVFFCPLCFLYLSCLRITEAGGTWKERPSSYLLTPLPPLSVIPGDVVS